MQRKHGGLNTGWRAPARATVAFATLAACAGCSESPETTTARAARAADSPPVVSVAVVNPRRGPIRRLTREPGQVEAYEVTSLFAKIGGYVRSLAVDTGDPIRAGQVIAEIEAPELQAAVEQKRALVEQAIAEQTQAEAAVEVAKAAVDAAEAKLVFAQASIRRADADVLRWLAEYKRMSQLIRENAVSGSILDETRSKHEAAQAASDETRALVRSAEAALTQARAELAKSQTDVAAAAARVGVARADLASAEVMVSYTRILAPFDGAIARRIVHTGHLTVPGGGADPLFLAERTDRLRITVGVPEVETPFVQPGDRAEVKFQALGGRMIEGTVARVSSSLDRANRTLRVEVDLDNPDRAIRPGLYAYVTIIAEEKLDALVLPASAIVRDGEKPYCVAVVNGAARHRELRLGIDDGKAVEIVSGLNGDETIVAAGLGSIVDGQAIQAAETGAK